ncbi:MAG: hypothetical protein SFY81_16730 [Verrucomicrobiota bacterium]|nr:hypothetical protein [Verrucomicrobiota bacterium]
MFFPESQRETTWLNIAALLVAAYLTVFMESTLDVVRNLTGAQFDLLPSLMVYVGMSYGFNTVLAVGTVSGVLYDSTSANPLGTSVLPLVLIGMLVLHNRDLLLRDQTYPQYVLGLAASIFAPIVIYLLLVGLGKPPGIGWYSLWQLAVMALIGGLFTPVWFYIFGKLDNALMYPSVPESAFRPDREIERGK